MSKITVYTVVSNSSSRKAVKFFEDFKIEAYEKRLGNSDSPKLTVAEVIQLAKLAGGFAQLIGERSKLYQEELKPMMELEETTTNDVIQYIINNPRVLRYPIITDGKKIEIGFNEDDVRVFLPRQLKLQNFRNSLRFAQTIQSTVNDEEMMFAY